MKNKSLFSIFLVVFVDLLGFSIILPLLPFYAESFGATATLVGLLVADYAAFQLIGAPILGRLSDRLGRRPVLLISIAGNTLGFLLLALAPNLIILFLARAISGLTGGNISVAQAYISDVTDEKNRARGLGMIGAAFGLGFIIGPAVGGTLSQWGFALPAFVSAAIGLINLILVYFWLPESLSAEMKDELSNANRPGLTLSALRNTLRRPIVGSLLYTRFFFGLAFALFQSIFALYALYRFNLNSQSTGYVLAYVGLLSVIVQGVIVGKLTNLFSDGMLITVAVGLMSVSLLSWAFVTRITLLLIVLAPIALAGGILNTVLNSALSKSVTPLEIGGTLGLAASLESATRVIAPSLGGWMIGYYGTSSPGIVAGVILIFLFVYVRRFVYKPGITMKAVEQPTQ